MNLLQVIKQKIQALPNFTGNYYYDFTLILTSIQLPKTQTDDTPSEEEEVDFENFGFSVVTDDELTFSVGGDWQHPLMITLALDDAGKIYVRRFERNFEDNWQIDFNKIMQAV